MADHRQNVGHLLGVRCGPLSSRRGDLWPERWPFAECPSERRLFPVLPSSQLRSVLAAPLGGLPWPLTGASRHLFFVRADAYASTRQQRRGELQTPASGCTLPHRPAAGLWAAGLQPIATAANGRPWRAHARPAGSAAAPARPDPPLKSYERGGGMRLAAASPSRNTNSQRTNANRNPKQPENRISRAPTGTRRQAAVDARCFTTRKTYALFTVWHSFLLHVVARLKVRIHAAAFCIALRVKTFLRSTR